MTYLVTSPAGGPVSPAPPAGSVTYKSLDPSLISTLVPLRNRIINGAPIVAQRPTATIAALAGVGVTAYGGPDRYRASSSAGGSFTQSQGAFAYAGRNLFAVTQTVVTNMTDNSGTNNWSGICQPIEGFGVADLRGIPVAVSFLFNATLAGNYTCAVRDGTGTMSCLFHVPYPKANVPTYYAFVTPPVPLTAIMPWSNLQGMAVNIGASNTGTYLLDQANEGQWVLGNYIVLSNGGTNWGVGGAGALIQVSELQVEAGLAATPIERRPFGLELLLCQRYYQVIPQIFASGYSVAGGSIWGHVSLPVLMRVNPTATIGSPGTSNASAATIDSTGSAWARITALITATGTGWSAASMTLSAEL